MMVKSCWEIPWTCLYGLFSFLHYFNYLEKFWTKRAEKTDYFWFVWWNSTLMYRNEFLRKIKTSNHSKRRQWWLCLKFMVQPWDHGNEPVSAFIPHTSLFQFKYLSINDLRNGRNFKNLMCSDDHSIAMLKCTQGIPLIGKLISFGWMISLITP